MRGSGAQQSLSAENWRALTVLQREFRRAEAARSDARETLDRLLLSLVSLAGFALDDMTQDDGWRLMMIGRRLERLQFLCDVLARRLAAADTPLRQELEWLLEIGDSAITYRTRYRAPPVWDNTIELLVYDEHNPRALAFQWRSVNTLLIEVAESLGTRPQDTLYEPIEDLIALRENPPGDDPLMVQASRRILVAVLERAERRGRAGVGSAHLAAFLARRFRSQGGDRMTRYAVRHATVYEYGGEVAHSHHLLHLTPREFEYQRCLVAFPGPRSAAELGARGSGCLRQRHRAARIRPLARSSVGHRRDAGRGAAARASAASRKASAWERVRERLSYHASAPRPADLEACRFRMRSRHVPLKHDGRGLRARMPHGRPADCRRRARAHAPDLPRLRLRSGRDHQPHLDHRRAREPQRRLPGLRASHDRLPACIGSRRALRERLHPDGARHGSAETLVGGDASHAWVSVYCPPHGWVDFDPTNDCVVGEDHVTLAWGRDFGDVSPLRGMIVGGGRHKLAVDVGVRRIG